MQIYFGGSLPFSGQAEVEDDSERCHGGGARAIEGLRERKKIMQKGENEERPVVPIYKEEADKWAQKMRRPKHDYLATQAPRFLGRH